MQRRRGHTLVELLVCTVLLGMLLGMVLAVYVTGASAWSKGDARTELVAGAQLAVSAMVQDLERSSPQSLSVSPDLQAVSALSPLDDQGQFKLDDQGRPIYQRWVLYSLNPKGELLRTQVPWTEAETVRVSPIPIEQLAPPQTIVDYLGGQSKVVARNLTRAQFKLLPDQTVSLQVELQKKRYGSPNPETVRLETLVKARN